MIDDQILENLVIISKKAAARSYVVAGEGNTSARSSSGSEFWIKRSGCSLAEAEPKDFIKLDVKSAVKDLKKAQEAVVYRKNVAYRASIEAAMHALIYASQERAYYVVHSHPPSALAGCCIDDMEGFFRPQFPDSIVYLGVPERNWIFLEYASPGTGISKLLRRALKNFNGELRVVILANHGIITIGQSATEAITRTEVLEKASSIKLSSMIAGKPTHLNMDDIKYLENMESERYRQRIMREQI